MTGIASENDCENCTAGKWSTATGITTDEDCNGACSAGKWSTLTGITSDDDCNHNCSAGKWSSATGITSDGDCNGACSTGTFSTLTGLNPWASGCDGSKVSTPMASSPTFPIHQQAAWSSTAAFDQDYSLVCYRDFTVNKVKCMATKRVREEENQLRVGTVVAGAAIVANNNVMASTDTVGAMTIRVATFQNEGLGIMCVQIKRNDGAHCTVVKHDGAGTVTAGPSMKINWWNSGSIRVATFPGRTDHRAIMCHSHSEKGAKCNALQVNTSTNTIVVVNSLGSIHSPDDFSSHVHPDGYSHSASYLDVVAVSATLAVQCSHDGNSGWKIRCSVLELNATANLLTSHYAGNSSILVPETLSSSHRISMAAMDGKCLIDSDVLIPVFPRSLNTTNVVLYFDSFL